MKSRQHLRALLVALSLAAASTQAAARPSLWQRVRDPESAQADALGDMLERLLAFGAELDPLHTRDFALGAIATADLAGAERLPGARLHCLLGRALVEVGSFRRAESVLARAVTEGPEGAFAASCFLAYSVTLARSGETEAEIKALTHGLEFAFDADVQAQIYCNRGEGFMALGRLGEALADFRRGAAMAQMPEGQALCQYDLGVALDRNGDLPAAWKALDVALSIRLPLTVFQVENALDLPDVFFTPAYEEHYFRGLASMASARRASDDQERRVAYERALLHWEAYLAAARSSADRYISQAELHAAACRKELKKIKPPRVAPAPELEFAEPPDAL
ncbi:MAG TPA: hypothetical protein VGP93_02690 [Polyangiaceae bacterium]|nr:hypothetical protein [Polyangiaceae bacterium]